MKTELAKAQALLNQKTPNPDQAIRTLKRLISRRQTNWLTYHYLGVAQLQKEEWEKGISYLKKALEKGSNEAETFHLISVAYYNTGNFGEAEGFAKLALEQNDNFFQAWLNLGSVYKSEARMNEALKCYQRANQIDPKNAGVAFRIAEIYKDQGDFDKALELFTITTKLDENYLQAYAEMAVIYQKLKVFDKAKECGRKMLEIDENSLGGFVGLAEIYKREGRYEEAITMYDDLIRKFPDNAAILVNQALCYQEMGLFNESEQRFREVIRRQPDLTEAFSNYLMGLHYNPENTREEIFKEHLRYNELHADKNAAERPVPENIRPDKKLRVALISGGLRKHPVGWMIIKGLENLPEDEFDIICYSTSNIVDDLTRRLNDRSLIWRNVSGYNDDVIDNLIRSDNPDILIELSGHSEDNRLKVITKNPAPITVKWVGGLYNTSGLYAMDYLLTDHYESPEGDDEFYTEKLVRMPGDYICFQAPDYAPDVKELPALENGYITFGCFNNPTKINPVLLDNWAEILRRIPDSKLLLKSRQYGTKMFTDRIIERMKAYGIEKDRLIFEAESTHDVLLDTYNKVDIALDPWPYSGGLTTCEALWMGVPVVSNQGPTFAGKHAATHLSNAGYNELVTDNWDNYISKAVSLASDITALSEMRKSMRSQVAGSLLCNGGEFGKNLAAAFREMWNQRVNAYNSDIPEGEWAEPIDVARLLNDEGSSSAAGSKKSSGNFALKTLSESISHAAMELKTAAGYTILTPDDPSNLTTYSMLENEGWLDKETELTELFLDKGDGFVDIGASFGAFALKAAAEGASVTAFEPGAQSRKLLSKASELNNFSDLTICKEAVSDKKSVVSFAAGVEPEFSTISEEGSSEVDSIALDDWWKDNGGPDIRLIKIDTNGSELQILDGASACISEQMPVLIIANSSAGTGHEAGSEGAFEKLRDLSYSFYQYLSAVPVLVEILPEDFHDPALLNIVAIPSAELPALKEKGIIYNVEQVLSEAHKSAWDKWSVEAAWTKDFSFKIGEDTEQDYILALNQFCEAELMHKSGNHTGSEQTGLYLSAAQNLINLYNSGTQDIAVSLTLSAALIKLGKKAQALEVLNGLIDYTDFGQVNTDTNRPFVLPFRFLNQKAVHESKEKWLMVRIIESWLHAKDESGYFSEETERKLLAMVGVLDEATWETKNRYLISSLTGDPRQDDTVVASMYKTAFRNRFSETLTGYLKKSFPRDEEELINLKFESYDALKTEKRQYFRKDFWEEPLNPEKAERVEKLVQMFSTTHFNDDLLYKISSECDEAGKDENNSILAFYIKSHALLNINNAPEPEDKESQRLYEQLEEKGWGHKKALYSRWFSHAEVFKEAVNPVVSAVLISNKFRPKMIKNLKALNEQLDGRGEIIFVNNGISADELQEVIPLINTCVHATENSGAYLARNLGALYAGGDYLLFVDDDGIPDADMIDAHLDVHRNRDIIVSRGVYYSDDPATDPWFYNCGDQICPSVSTLEGNVCYDSSIFYKAGGWGDYILFGHGGKDLSIRLLEIESDKRKQIYTPYARLNHNYIRGLSHQKKKVKKQGHSEYLLRAKHTIFRSLFELWPTSFK